MASDPWGGDINDDADPHKKEDSPAREIGDDPVIQFVASCVYVRVCTAERNV